MFGCNEKHKHLHRKLRKLKSFFSQRLDALSKQSKRNQKLIMALPIHFTELIYTDDLSLQVALFTIISLLLSLFVIPQDSECQAEPEGTRHSEQIKTPQKRPRTIRIPDAPQKKPRTSKPLPGLKPKALFTEEEKLPVTHTKTPTVHLPKIKDLRTLPSLEHNLLSFGTEINYKLTYSTLKTQLQAEEILNTETTHYDITGPISERRAVSIFMSDCIKQHIQSLINIKAALTFLNKTKSPLPSNGSSTLMSYKDGSNYLLSDKVFNAICYITIFNYNLSKALDKVYDTHKSRWSKIPLIFENDCALTRDAHILASHISRLYSINVNMTSWADW